MNEERDGTEESVLSQLLGGRNLIEFFTPRRETTALLSELRRNPATKATLDGTEEVTAQAGGNSRVRTAHQAESRDTPEPVEEQPSTVLQMVVDYANGMTQEEIARKRGLHVQTVRKRLKSAGVTARVAGTTLADWEIDEARKLLEAGMSAREIGRKYGVAHTTVLRPLRLTETSLAPRNHPNAPDNE